MNPNVSDILEGFVSAFREGVPELKEVDTLRGQLDPDKLVERLAKLPAAFVALAGMRPSKAGFRPQGVAGPYALVLTAFLVIPGRKDQPEPVSLVGKVANLVSTLGFSFMTQQPEFEGMENLVGVDGGRDWIYLYAIRWSVSGFIGSGGASLQTHGQSHLLHPCSLDL